MKKLILSISIAALFVFAVSCSGGSSNVNKQSNVENTKTVVYYTCTMHPEVHLDKPGDCPKCGMTLVKAEENVSDTTKMNHQ